MIPIVRREKPDLLLTERWPEAVRVAFGFDIPAWTIFYDERESHVNQMVFPISSKVFAPKFYTLQDLYRNGVSDPEKIVWFNGFHTCYLKGEPHSTENAYSKLGVKPPIVLVRPEPEFATYFPSHKPVLETTVSNITKSGIASVVVMPRTESPDAAVQADGRPDSRRVDLDVPRGERRPSPRSRRDHADGGARPWEARSERDLLDALQARDRAPPLHPPLHRPQAARRPRREAARGR